MKAAHSDNCDWPYGHDCCCGMKEFTHNDDCGFRYGHDCDCGYEEYKKQRNSNRRSKDDFMLYDSYAASEGRAESWTVVKADPSNCFEDLLYWCDHHPGGRYSCDSRSLLWIFQYSADAVLFSLRWPCSTEAISDRDLFLLQRSLM